jgi:hypothetical protein
LILYNLGTNFGKETYTHPIDKKLVSVTTQPNFESGTIYNTIGRELASSNLTNGENSFFCIEFKNIFFVQMHIH